MKASELRIGNYTEYHILDENQDEWIFNEVEISDLADADDLRPIPLTEEWLVKFGFEPHKELEHLLCKDNLVVNIGNQNIVSIGWIDSGKERYYPFQSNHVHQLQNLYFALTGKELCN